MDERTITLFKRNKACIELQKIVEKLCDLPNKNFAYDHFVTSYDRKSECGTVCCIAGWYPKWFPDSNLKWSKVGSLFVENDLEEYQISEALCRYHKLSTSIIHAVFYGHDLHSGKSKIVKDHSNLSNVTKDMAITRIRKIQKAILDGKLDSHIQYQIID